MRFNAKLIATPDDPDDSIEMLEGRAIDLHEALESLPWVTGAAVSTTSDPPAIEIDLSISIAGPCRWMTADETARFVDLQRIVRAPRAAFADKLDFLEFD